MKACVISALLYLLSHWIGLPQVTAQPYLPLGDSLTIERIVIERPSNYEPGDILIPNSYATELKRAEVELKAFRPRYDSLIRVCDSLYHELHWHQIEADSIYQAQRKFRDQLIDEIYALGADAVQSQDLLYDDIRGARHRQKLLQRKKRSGFIRELLYHPTTTPTGRVLVGGLVISFTALTTVTIISLIAN